MNDKTLFLLAPSTLALCTAVSGFALMLAERFKTNSWREFFIPPVYSHPFKTYKRAPTIFGIREGVFLGIVGFVALWVLAVGGTWVLAVFGAGSIGRWCLALFVYGVLLQKGVRPGIVGLIAFTFRALDRLYRTTPWWRRLVEEREKRDREKRRAIERKRSTCQHVWAKSGGLMASGIILVCERCGYVDNSGYYG